MAKRAPYFIGDEEFPTKDDVTERCREIIRKIPDGQLVPVGDIPFLINLFQNHDGWIEKSSKGVKNIIVDRSGPYLTRGFILVLSDDSTIDISFTYVIKLLRGDRTRVLLPQALVDYKSAARGAITEDIRSFRDAHISLGIMCPISGEMIIRENCEVDHEPPCTFDKLLFDFTEERKVDPIKVKVGSKDGVEPFFEDEALSAQWVEYHREHAKLRLLTAMGHTQVKSPRMDWKTLINR